MPHGFAVSTAELKQLVESLLLSQKETDRQMKETGLQMKATERQLKELGKQLGGLGNKFGSFTEGLACASIEKVLRDKFQIENIAFRLKVRKAGREQEFDALGYTNGTRNRAIVVEIKSNLTAEALQQMEDIMDSVFTWLPEHGDKGFEGMICYVNGSKNEREAALKRGWHLLHVGDEVFKLEDPKGFKPRIYQATKASPKRVG
ncbi:MAG: hypothetical protein RLZZ282_511 [Verrucomicrobiota bacterium]|jgi:hypothetical protein